MFNSFTGLLSRKRKALVYGNGLGTIAGFGYNSKFLFYNIAFKERKDAFAFTECRFVSADAGAAGDAWSTNISWLMNEKDCQAGDCLFLFNACHGNTGTAGHLSVSGMYQACAKLSEGVNVFYYTGACSVACPGNQSFHFTVDRASNTMVPYQGCHIPTSQGAVKANVVTVATTQYGVLAASDYNVWAERDGRNPGQKYYPYRNFMVNKQDGFAGSTETIHCYIYEHMQNLLDVTVEQFVLNLYNFRKLNPNFTPVVGCSKPELLKSVLPLYLSNYDHVSKDRVNIIQQDLRDAFD
jgi:hypothetical protein